MEKVYEELDEAKAEIEKLRSENRAKAELCENLKRSHNEQVKRVQELNLKLEKQVHELVAYADENYTVKQSIEDLKCKVKEKESILRSLTSANDKVRVDFHTKLQKSEEENRGLVFALEEANVKVSDLERKNNALKDQIEVLKEGFLSVSQKKSSDANKKVKTSNEMRRRGDMLDKAEDENVKLQEQLKWKKEQFKHLEDAHERLKNNLRVKEKEWDSEKRAFLDEISTLETKLDSQIRLSEDLQRRLEMCKQALAHEETRRKCIEVQLSDPKSWVSECEEAKEMEYKIGKLEEENQDLKLSLKKLRESQIQEATSSPFVTKLRNKVKSLEDSLSQSKVKEAEWGCQFEKVVADLNSSRSELASKVAILESRNRDLVKARETIKEQCEEIKALKEENEGHEFELSRTKSELQNVCYLLDVANEQVDQSFYEVNEAEFELQIWKSFAEKQEANLEQSHRMRREVEAALLAQVDMEVKLQEEKDSLVHTLEEKDRRIEELQRKLENGDGHENPSPDQRMDNLQQIMRCLEEDFDQSTCSFSSQLAKMTEMVVLKEIGVEEKDLMIIELEKNLEEKVEFGKQCLLSVKKLSLEKEKLMGIIGGVSERINKLSREDGQLMGTLRSIVSSFDENGASGNDCFDPVKENTDVYPSPKRKTVETSVDERSPLRALND